MHLLETYSLLSNCKISECFIQDEQIDLPNKQYITFHGFNPKGSTRQYKHWHTVIELLNNDNRFDYEIIQIGGHIDPRYNGTNTSYLGKTTYNSLAYLIKNCSLHLGYDSFPIHLASHYQKKIVGIYAHFIKNSGPYFSKTEDIILFEPDSSITKPVFSENDPLGRINSIDPKLIYEAVIKLLCNQ
jgi:ADP-heptose:LPS heptosyltransferase